MAKSYFIKTLGCKTNLTDSQTLSKTLEARGWMPAEKSGSAELVIVNSCTVTDAADRESWKWVRTYKKKNPSAQIVITGCAVSKEAEKEKALDQSKLNGVHLLQNLDKNKLSTLVAPWEEGYPGTGKPVEVVPSSTHRTRAFLNVQDGCNSFCTYCIIPYARGKSRSKTLSDIIREVDSLVAGGAQEIVITGINLGDYEGGVTGLVKEILRQTSIARIRLGSLDPLEIEPELLDLMTKESRICPHLHVSLQSIDSRILRRMKRKYRQEDAIEKLHAIEEAFAKRGAGFVGMDMITGFPGESDAVFEEGKQILAGLPWDRLHVFPYSEREGTPATRLQEVVPVHIRKKRSQELARMSVARMKERLCKKGWTGNVLLEGPTLGPDGTRNWIGGYSMDYRRAILRSPPEKVASFINRVVRFQAQQFALDKNSQEILMLGRVVN